LKAEKGWVFKLDGAQVAAGGALAAAKRIFEIQPVRWLLEKGTVVICAGGGGIPTMYEPDKHRWLTGIEAVIDKDLASELLAREVVADLLVIATDVDGIYLEWGKPEQRKLGWITRGGTEELPIPCRLHGTEGGGSHPVCGANRQARGHWCAGEISSEIVAGTAGTNIVAG
jgi:carbamate kinase